MRSRVLNCVLLVALAAVGVAAQRVQVNWLRIAPEGEEFAVHVPEPNWRIRRAVPFGGATLKPVSYEVAYGGLMLSVLSFPKSEPSAPKTLDAFVKGFRQALGDDAKLELEREVKLDGRVGRQFRLATGAGQGTARVYETGQHFYVVMTYGGADAPATSAHFHDSFTFDTSGADRVPLSASVEGGLLSTVPQPPAPLWPTAGGVTVYGIASAPKEGGGAPEPDVAGDAQKRVVKGGVLNGKALTKPVPVYPPIARAARAQGTVTIQILVDEEGYVVAASAVSGHPLLQHASALAARQARFTPTLLSGQPVKVSGVITYNFVSQ